MPSSTIAGKTAIAFILKKLNALSCLPQIIDVGAGCGTYHRLMSPLLKDVHWTAVEIWAPYVAAHKLDALYDNIYISDARCFDFSILPKGGVAIFGDVLEHLTKPQAEEVVTRAMKSVDFAILSIPLGEWPQEASVGNTWEAHIGSWTAEDVHKLAGEYFAGEIDYGFNLRQSLANVFLARTPRLKDLLVPILEEAKSAIGKNHDLIFCGMAVCPSFLDKANVDKFHSIAASL